MTKVTESSITLALDEVEPIRDFWNDILVLKKLANEATYRKMKEALASLESISFSSECPLVRVYVDLLKSSYISYT